jgi:hypothetical protein
MRTKLLCIILISICPTLVGCTALGVEYGHTSHPFAGPPFGPDGMEDTLDAIYVNGRYEYGRFYVDSAVGYKVTDGGLTGPKVVWSGRFGVMLYDRRRQ